MFWASEWCFVSGGDEVFSVDREGDGGMNLIRQMLFAGAWPPVELLEKMLKHAGYSFRYGERENQTDGEEHWIVRWRSEEFELHANRWDPETFVPLIDWIESL